MWGIFIFDIAFAIITRDQEFRIAIGLGPTFSGDMTIADESRDFSITNDDYDFLYVSNQNPALSLVENRTYIQLIGT